MNKPSHKASGSLFAEPHASPSRMDGSYTANIDGAARGNPGPASYGLVVRRPDGSPLESLGKYIGRHTNNAAEYYALIAALDYATANGIKRLRVQSDSQLIVNQMRGAYKVKHPDLRPLYERAKKQAEALDAFAIEYVPREQNRAADKLANTALDNTAGVKPAFAPVPAETMNPAQGLYLEDLYVGQRFSSGLYHMDEDRIKAFAAQFDPQPFHVDEATAKRSIFRGLVASGWHTAAATMRLLVTGGLPLAGMVGLRVEIAWPKPTRPGDTLRVNSEILEISPSRSKPNQGVVSVRSITVNQNGDEVQILTTRVLAFKRTPDPIASD